MRGNSDQIVVINSLRGFAALSVCFYHFVIITTLYWNDQNVIDVFEYGRKGIHVFFIISGIVIPLSMIRSNYKVNLFGKYLLRRFVRIEPPYLAAVVLGVIYLHVRNFIPSAADVDLVPSFMDIVLHVGYLIPFVEGANWINPVFWTLSIEFQYYIFLALLFPLALSNKLVLRLIFYALIIGLPFLFTNNNFFFGWSSFFGLGIFYALFISKKYTLTEFIIVMLICSIAVYMHKGLLDLSIAFATLLVIHLFPKFETKVGSFMGDISYSLYLLHTIVGVSFINFISVWISSPIEKFLVVAIALFISIVSAYAFWRLIEKPSQLASRKIKLKEVAKT